MSRDALKIAGALLILAGVATMVRLPEPGRAVAGTFASLTSSDGLRLVGVGMIVLGTVALVIQALVKD